MFQEQYDACVRQVEQHLYQFFTGGCAQQGLQEAMRYSLLAGGKRVRPVLLLQFCKAAGGRVADALDFACAVEMLHTYSLVHDDLPCMDNDDLRRGKPTNHMVYGECVATLVGDALQAEAFRTILTARGQSLGARARVAAALAQAAGIDGICGGQYLDMKGDGEELTLSELTLVHHLKTAALLRASCVMGVLAAGKQPEDPMCRAASDYADAFGLAFQIRDDMLDCIATTEQLGKPVGSDVENNKNTFVRSMGLEACEKLVLQQTELAKHALDGVFPEHEFLNWMADQMAKRNA